jgi:hypothetical protein
MPHLRCPDRSAMRERSSLALPLPASLPAILMLLAVPTKTPPCSATPPQPLCGVTTLVADPDDATCELRWSQVACFIPSPDGTDAPGGHLCGIRVFKSTLWATCGRPTAIIGGCP